MRSLRPTEFLIIAGLFVASLAIAQAPVAPAPVAAPAGPAVVAAIPAAPATPSSPVQGIRNKLSAGDLLSAESMLESHGARVGQDGPYLVGMSWLARDALLMGDAAKAHQYATDVLARCADSLAHGARLDSSHDVEIALGAAIEVEAQLLEQEQGARTAADYVKAAISRNAGPVPFAARLHKRLNMLSWTGATAPELVPEDFVGSAPPALALLKGKPVMVFLWSATCGDCKAQAATIARVKAKAGSDVQWIALTRYYEDDAKDRPAEKAVVDSVWKSVYADAGTVPIVISTASMVTYGGSSTPTFVFIDRRGIVRGYTPTRLTEAEFDRQIAAILC